MKGSRRKLTEFGKLVAKALVDREMTRGQLAQRLGTSPQYLSYMLNGTRPAGKHLPGIVAALGLDPLQAERALRDGRAA